MANLVDNVVHRRLPSPMIRPTAVASLVRNVVYRRLLGQPGGTEASLLS